MRPLIVKNPFKAPLIPSRTHWSYSSLKLFRKCHRKFFWKQILRLSPRREAKPLVVSNAGHEGLAKWYGGKRTSMRKIATQIVTATQKRIKQNMSFYDQKDYDELQVLLNTLIGILIAYAELYFKDREKWQFTKDDVEKWFEVNLGSFDFRGKIDLLPTQKKKLLVVDHKIVGNIGSSFVEKLPMDGQLRGYIIGATQGLQRKPAKVCYNFIRKCKLRRKTDEPLKVFTDRIKNDYLDRPEFYFQRETLRFSKDDVEAFVHSMQITNMEYTYISSSSTALDPRDWPDSDHCCDEFFRTCPYLPLCLQGLDLGTAKLYTQYNKDNKKKGKK